MATASTTDPTLRGPRPQVGAADESPGGDRLQTLAAGAGLLAVAVGVLVLAGWALGLELLLRPGDPFASVNPLTAVCFTLTGASLWLLHRQEASGWRRRIGCSAALAVTFV